MSRIHATAIIEDGARLHAGVEVGPYSIIGARVELGEGCVVGPHVVLRGPLRAGRDNRFFQFCSIGELSQDLSAREDEDTSVEIGDGNIFREYVTVQRGTLKDTGVTRVGNHNLLMNGVHLAHDCVIGDHNVLANGTALAGHAQIEDWVVLGGFTLVHQFARLGAHCFSGGGATIQRDVPPWVLCDGHPAVPRGVNKIGLKRRGFSDEDIAEVERIYRLLYRSDTRLAEAREQLGNDAAQSPLAAQMHAFLERSSRSILR